MAANRRNKLELTGLLELRNALRALPVRLAEDGGDIVQTAAQAALASIRQAYPERTGNLKRGLVLESDPNPRAGVQRFWVRNRAPHAYLYEHGTQGVSRELLGTGQYRAGTNRGPMPAGNKFIPAAIRARELMTDRLIHLVEEAGFSVTRG